MSHQGYVDVDGGCLCWDASGYGAPIILLHGFSFDRRSWNPQMAALAAAHRVVRYDLRGFGASTVPTGPYRHIDDLRRLIETLSIENPLLVGLSLGANIALAYAMEHAEEVAGLVLASPGLPGHRWTEQRPPEAASAYASVHGKVAGKRYWLGHPIFDSLHDYPQAQASVAQMVNDYSGWHWMNPDLQRAGPDIRAGLGGLAPPLLVISGDRDVQGYREIAAEIACTVPHGSLVRLGDAGHVMNLEQPEEFTEKVLQFAARINPKHGAPGMVENNFESVVPSFDLEPPGTYVFDGAQSSRGFLFNRFALSLKQPLNRERFLRDEMMYASSFGLSAEEMTLVAKRDWTGMLRAGGHLQAILKLAATVGQNLYHIGAHNCGVDVAALQAACPRRVSGLGSLSEELKSP